MSRTEPQPEALAAVDLGSNSFHMVIAHVEGEGLRLVDRLKEGVRLAAYLGPDQEITAEGRKRALDCLERFGQRIRDLPPGSVRAVGTNTLRQARNARELLHDARRALGRPIEVVPGQEEARLIYLGVARSVAPGPDRRLVVDIGGGSTECIVGRGFECERAESLYMGCVSFTERYFPGGRLDAEGFRRASLAARLELETIRREYAVLGWEQCVGSSGTILAVERILLRGGWSEQGVTSRGLRKLRKAMVKAGSVGALSLDGLSRDRAPVLPGGLAILEAVFRSLEVERMIGATGALREGVLFDLWGRIRHDDVREVTIRRLMERYHVDRLQAARVEATAAALFTQVAGGWQLDRGEGRRYLSWAARLHEIGLGVSHSGFHKHGAYLVDHSDLGGFSLQERLFLSLLVRFHRRKLRAQPFGELPDERAEEARRLCILLRLAVLLNRSRSRRPLPALGARAEGARLSLLLPEEWVESHPLTRADLELEQGYLQAAGYELQVVGETPSVSASG